MFKLHGNKILTHKTHHVDNREYDFVKTIEDGSLNINYINEEVYIFVVMYDNIGHFFA